MYKISTACFIYRSIFAVQALRKRRVQGHCAAYHFRIDNKAVLLGTKDGQYNILVNHIINIIKHYIYITKCNNRILSQFGALAKVREVFCIEQNILLQYKKESNLLNNKWDPVLNFFQEVFKDKIST